MIALYSKMYRYFSSNEIYGKRDTIYSTDLKINTNSEEGGWSEVFTPINSLEKKKICYNHVRYFWVDTLLWNDVGIFRNQPLPIWNRCCYNMWEFSFMNKSLFSNCLKSWLKPKTGTFQALDLSLFRIQIFIFQIRNNKRNVLTGWKH